MPSIKSQIVIPADIPDEVSGEIRKIAVKAFRAVNGSEFSRVDFFMEYGTNKVIINEINTIPGFTEISMYPKLWQEAGLDYSDLLDKLIRIVVEK